MTVEADCWLGKTAPVLSPRQPEKRYRMMLKSMIKLRSSSQKE